MSHTIESFRGVHRWLSNFWPVKIYFDGLIYPTVEHAYQAAKTWDMNTRKKIRNLSTPGESKKYWTENENDSPSPDWETKKLNIMRVLIEEKFSFHNEIMLLRVLVDTYDTPIIEGNTWGDTFWGMTKENEIWSGENHLGNIIMNHRSRLLLIRSSLEDYSKRNRKWSEECLSLELGSPEFPFFKLTAEEFFKAKMAFGIK